MQSFMSKILIIIFAIQLLGFKVSHAQTKVQVVSQKISKIIDWEPGVTLQLHAERAEIFCTNHLSKTIDIEVIIVAKHEDKSIAEADLKKMKWMVDKTNKKIFLRNYIELARNEAKPESDIKTIYHIKVPMNCVVDISNYFGLIELENIKSNININGEFSKIKLTDINGESTIKTTFGDISARGISGDIHIESNRSDIDLQDITGILDLHAILAEININAIEKVSKINIDAEKSKVKINVVDFNRYSFQFELHKTDLITPDRMKPEFTINDDEIIVASFKKAKELPQIEIKINTGTLTIE